MREEGAVVGQQMDGEVLFGDAVVESLQLLQMEWILFGFLIIIYIIY